MQSYPFEFQLAQYRMPQDQAMRIEPLDGPIQCVRLIADSGTQPNADQFAVGLLGGRAEWPKVDPPHLTPAEGLRTKARTQPDAVIGVLDHIAKQLIAAQ